MALISAKGTKHGSLFYFCMSLRLNVIHMLKSILRQGIALVVYLNIHFAQAQNQVVPGINGNFEINAQYYQPDEAIGAPEVPEEFLSNSFLNLNYVNGNIRAGLRYEAYLNPLLGFDARYKGSGIPFRYAGYTYEGLDVTVGNFYDQFGNGLIFRSYEERALGIDNAIDGIRVGYQPVKGIYIKGLTGKQRDFLSLVPVLYAELMLIFN